MNDRDLVIGSAVSVLLIGLCALVSFGSFTLAFHAKDQARALVAVGFAAAATFATVRMALAWYADRRLSVTPKGFARILGGIGLFFVVGLLVKKEPPAPTVQAQHARTVEEKPREVPRKPEAPPEPPVPPKRLTFDEALATYRLSMRDSHDRPSDGALMMAGWLSKYGALGYVTPPSNETSLALAKKDPDKERGRLLCVRGTLIQIERIRGTEVFAGNMMVQPFHIVNFLAARDTGDLVEDSRAKFCGIVAGLYTFSNVSGGTTNSVQLVGMFDLPGNEVEPRETWVAK